MRKLLVVIIVAVIFISGFYLWWQNGISSVNPKDKNVKLFVIPKGAAIRLIGNDLKSQGLIKDPVVFFLYIKQNSLDKNIQAGSYRLSPSMNLAKIMDTLGHGTLDIWVTIPEGLRAEEVAEVLQREIPSFQTTWIEALKAVEGYLFPDTYLIPKDADITTIISIFKNNFYAKIESIGLSKTDPNLKKIVILASLIEREALRNNEKPLVASVLYNRLADRMALDIDATLQYAKGKTNGKWWSVPTGADRQIDSLYNTYKYPGIPPGPIANPGLEALRAAKNPATSGYYYYIHDNKGDVHFSKTISEHNKNIQKYLN